MQPFKAGGVARPPFFIGREGEIAQIVEGLAGGSRSFLLTGPRRVGKSSLVANVLDHLRDHPAPVVAAYVDCRRITDARSFFDETVHRVLEAYEAKRPVRGWLKLRSRLFTERVRDLIPKVDAIGGTVGEAFHVYLDLRESTPSPDDLIRATFAFLERFPTEHGLRLALLIDEFQELKALRTQLVFQMFKSVTDQQPDLRICYTGSSLGLIDDVFHQPDSPLYLTASRIGLGSLPEDVVRDFVRERFGQEGIRCPPDQLHAFHEATGGIPYYMQALGELVYHALVDAGRAELTEPLLLAARDELLDKLSPEFEVRLEHRYGPLQRAILLALAPAPEGLSRNEIAERSGRPTGQMTMALQSLIAAFEIVNPERGMYRMTDHVFAAWLQERLGTV